ncbi:hypothetical protein A3762_04370 [Oleiphilus sp. HI0125]|uniref:hypothetical protein n=1 Tax=Oleiphilus sp. HI0125 TaxID=1822266 RepID=UPI0007C3F387|nr:hypothetical protein [Oleiphilus sp. HI0125]KZZ59733.1 hypothetical protein A3762_04370 [Oleiphilus sp. HI0125]
MTTKNTFRAVLCTFIFLISANAHSAIIFQDDFSRINSDDVGPAWLTNEAQDNDVAIYLERLRLRDIPSAGFTFAQIDIDTHQYVSLELSFDWQVLSSTEKSDTLLVELMNTAAKSIIFETTLETAGSYNASILLSDAAITSIRFALDVNSQTETVYLDNIQLEGIKNPVQKPIAKVDESSSFGLFLLGLAGLICCRLRNNNLVQNKAHK